MKYSRPEGSETIEVSQSWRLQSELSYWSRHGVRTQASVPPGLPVPCTWSFQVLLSVLTLLEGVLYQGGFGALVRVSFCPVSSLSLGGQDSPWSMGSVPLGASGGTGPGPVGAPPSCVWSPCPEMPAFL